MAGQDRTASKRIKSMVIKANPTVQPPQAPNPPAVAQQALRELVNYYRSLAHFHRSSVDYHRQLLEQHSQDAEVAEKQLASVEEITTDAKKSEVEADKPVTQSSPKKNAQTKITSSKAAKTKKPTQKKNTNKTKKPTLAFSSRLPYSEKLAASESIVDAVALCLQEYYPTVISAEELVKYYYPEGLDRETKKRI